jgi:signal-transduction protein with cAMP-binding, CBS, and nucleotidyltransferase domain
MPTIEKLVVRNVVSLDEKTTCKDAACLMAQRRIGAVGVTRGGALVGLVTDRDLVFNVLARERPGTLTLGEVMHPDAPSVAPSATERDCAHAMQMHSTRHLLVKEGGVPVGLITMLDVLSLMLEDNRWLIEQLNAHIRRSRGR